VIDANGRTPCAIALAGRQPVVYGLLRAAEKGELAFSPSSRPANEDLHSPPDAESAVQLREPSVQLRRPSTVDKVLALQQSQSELPGGAPAAKVTHVVI